MRVQVERYQGKEVVILNEVKDLLFSHKHREVFSRSKVPQMMIYAEIIQSIKPLLNQACDNFHLCQTS